MDDSGIGFDTDSGETADHEQDERLELETLTREDDWGREAFRDAGEETFEGR